MIYTRVVHQQELYGTTKECPGTLKLFALETLETLELLHGYRIARRIEQASSHLLQLSFLARLEENA